MIIMAALKVLILAGGHEPAANHHSHSVHVRALAEAAEQRGVARGDVAIFWADGEAPGADRHVVRPEDLVRDEWLLQGTRLDGATRAAAQLEDTRFPGHEVRPAKRRNLKAWFAREGKKLRPGDTLLLAVTDHGNPDPDGGWNARISLWGEQWTAKELEQDLAAVPEGVRILLWMSQCFGGGFAELHLDREGLCGAFAAGPDRPAYGCFPELAGRDDVGHFLRFLDALGRHDGLAAATDEAMLTDDAPDTPHLTSDAWLFELIGQEAERRGVSTAALIDANLPRGADPRSRALAARIATQYGLGDVPDQAAAEAVRGRVEEARFALTQWDGRWGDVLDADRARLAEPFTVEVARDAPRQARLNARRGILRQLKASLVEQPALDARLAAARERVDRADELGAKLDLQEAAALRISYLFARVAAPALLSGPSVAQLAALRACEGAPVFPSPAQAPEGEPALPPVLPSVAHLETQVAALRPGYLGVHYDESPEGAVLTGVREDGPGGAAGLRRGDRLVTLDGAPLNAKGELRGRVALAGADARVRFTGVREGKPLAVEVKLAAMPLPPRPLRPGDRVPDLELGALDAPLPALGGDRGTVLFFWTTHCAPCKRALRPLQRWAIAHNAQVIAITDEAPERVSGFHQKFRLGGKPFPFPIAIDGNDRARQLFEIDSTPVFVYVDGRGRMADAGEGFSGKVPLRDPR